MESLKVKSIKLDSDGFLKVETYISDNLELAKFVSKDRMEKCFNNHPLEMHIYQKDFMISSITYKGKIMSFDVKDFMKFLEQKHL